MHWNNSNNEVKVPLAVLKKYLISITACFKAHFLKVGNDKRVKNDLPISRKFIDKLVLHYGLKIWVKWTLHSTELADLLSWTWYQLHKNERAISYKHVRVYLAAKDFSVYFMLFHSFSAIFIQKELLNEYRMVSVLWLRSAQWSNVGAMSATAWPPGHCHSQRVSSLYERKSVLVSSRLILCKAAATANLVFMCSTVRNIIYTHTFLNDKTAGDAFLCYGFFIVFSLKKKTAVEWQKKKKTKKQSGIVQKQIMVQPVSSTSGTHCCVYYFQKPLSFRRPCSGSPAGRNPLMLHMRLSENPVWDGLSFCNRHKSKLPVDMKPFFVRKG